MSAANLILSAAELALVQKALIKPQRSFGGLVAPVTIEEVHDDDVTLTEHPVERGAPISDHAYKQPARLSVTMGWSSSPSGTSLLGSIASIFGVGSNKALTASDAYAKLLKMQSDFNVIDITTGKRKYSDMFITGLKTKTDPDTENILLVTAECQQLLYATTTVVQTSIGARQSSPEVTGPMSDGGERRLQNAPYWKN